MEPRDIEEMVHRQVRKYVEASVSRPSRKGMAGAVLCILNRADPLIEQAIYGLRELDENGIPVTLLMAEPVMSICRTEGLVPWGNIKLADETKLPMMIMDLDTYSLVIYPAPGFSLAKRIAELDDENPYVQLAVRAVQSGVSVALAEESIGPPRKGIAAPEMKITAESLRKRISGLGIRIIPLSALYTDVTTRIDRFQGKVVTEETVKDFQKANMWDINVGPRTVITPLARDKAKEIGIRINRIE